MVPFSVRIAQKNFSTSQHPGVGVGRKGLVSMEVKPAMPVQWRNPSRVPLGPTFLRVPPERTVIILTRPDEHATLLLHWQGDGKGSFPCLGPVDCELCPTGRFLHSYTGVLVYNSRNRTWVKAILDLGNPSEGVASTDYTGAPVVIARGKGRYGDNRIIAMGRPKDTSIAVPEILTPFDVRPSLLRRWGLFDDANTICTEAYYEQARLPFPAPGGGNEAQP